MPKWQPGFLGSVPVEVEGPQPEIQDCRAGKQSHLRSCALRKGRNVPGFSLRLLLDPSGTLTPEEEEFQI